MKYLQVIVKGYGPPENMHKDSEISVPLSTTIFQLKKMKILCGGKTSGDETPCFATDKFTLGHKGRELCDEETLASIYTPGENLVLQFHTFTFTIKEQYGRWEFPFTAKVEDIEDRNKYDKIIKAHLYLTKDISPERVHSLSYGWPNYYPHQTVNVTHN